MIENYFLELKYQNLTKKLKSCIFLILNIWEKTVQPFIIHNDFHKTINEAENAKKEHADDFNKMMDWFEGL